MSVPADRSGRLAGALRTCRFAVPAEIGPPRGADVAAVRMTCRDRNRIALQSTCCPWAR
ncbi:MAG: hypothetical protein ACRDRH_16195 [Pseudonocardia sp.]